jgi:hypothetical protein
MSSIDFDEESIKLDKEIQQMATMKDIWALETSMMDFKKRKAEAMKNVNFCNKNISELEQRVLEKKRELEVIGK